MDEHNKIVIRIYRQLYRKSTVQVEAGSIF